MPEAEYLLRVPSYCIVVAFDVLEDRRPHGLSIAPRADVVPPVVDDTGGCFLRIPLEEDR
jgi:hypothetical protein